LNLQGYGFLFAPIHILALISDRLATIHHLLLFPKTDDLEIWVSRSIEVKYKGGFELAAYGFLFPPHTM